MVEIGLSDNLENCLLKIWSDFSEMTPGLRRLCASDNMIILCEPFECLEWSIIISDLSRESCHPYTPESYEVSASISLREGYKPNTALYFAMPEIEMYCKKANLTLSCFGNDYQLKEVDTGDTALWIREGTGRNDSEILLYVGRGGERKPNFNREGLSKGLGVLAEIASIILNRNYELTYDKPPEDILTLEL